MHRLGVIGYGGMGGWHVKNALVSDVVELAGIYDIKEERREVARKKIFLRMIHSKLFLVMKLLTLLRLLYLMIYTKSLL